MLQKKLVAVVESIRAYNGIVCVFSLLNGFFFFNHSVLPILWIAALSFFLAHSAITIQNDIADIDIDKINSPHRPLVSHILTKNESHSLVILLSATALFISAASLFLFIMVCLFYILGFFYNEKPFYFSRRPFISLLILGSEYTLIPMIGGIVIATHSLNNYVIATIYCGGWYLLRIATSILKDFGDMVGDKIFNKHTFLLTFGSNLTVIVSTVIALVGYIFVIGIDIFYLHINIKFWFFVMSVIFTLFLRFQLFSKKNKRYLFSSIFQSENRNSLFHFLFLVVK